MMKKIIIRLSLVWFSCMSCCEKPLGHEYIYIVNKSNKNIRCEEIWMGKIIPSDTVHQCQNIPFLIFADSVYSLSSSNADRGRGWEYDFNVIPYIQFLIMDNDTYMRYILEPCDSIRKNVPILHRYQLTLEDLQRMNWMVVYPLEK